MSRARSIPVRDVRAQCELLEKAVRLRGLATPDELTPHRPGGAENADRGPAGWLRFFAQLHRVHARGEAPPARGQDLPPGFAREDAIGLDALRNAPHEVQVRDLTGGDAPRILKVYPKGLGALTFLHARDWLLGWLAQRLATVQARGTSEDLALALRTHTEIARQYALIVWVVTHPGPGLPFAPDASQATLEPPADLQALDPTDVLRIAGAHGVVNGQRLHATRALLGRQVATEPPGSLRPSWSAFVGSLAIELQTRPSTLMWDWSLAELLLAVQSAAAMQTDSRQRAEAQAQDRAPVLTLGG